MRRSPGCPGGVGLLDLGVSVMIGNVLESIVVGRALGLSAIVVLLSMVFRGWMFGMHLGRSLPVPGTG